MAQFHFVEDYERHVKNLMDAHPIDTAMSLAVGGNFDEFGKLQAELLKKHGLENGMTICDLGCGSGRTAVQLGKLFPNLRYTGKDVVESLLGYARSKTPKHFAFVRNENLTVPLRTGEADMVCAFSLFTHLLHEETFIYLQDIKRALRLRGKLVFSFLQFAQAHHWDVFESTVSQRMKGTGYHLNTFIEESVIDLWAAKIGFEVLGYDRQHPMGQTIAVLRAG